MSVFLRLLTYVRRTILRARTRSALTVLGTALAIGLFSFVGTLEAGVRRLAQATDVPILVVFQSSRFCPLQSELPTRYEDDIERVAGVDSILPSLLYINSCRANLDLVTLHGIPSGDALREMYDVRALQGDLDSWRSRPDGALVGARMAERRGIRPGQRVSLDKVDVHVGGIITSPDGALDNVAFVHMEQLQLAREKQGKATQFLVRLEPGADAAAVAREIDATFAKDEQPTDTKTMQAFVQGAVGEIAEVVDFGRLLGYLAVAVVVLILANTVWISAQTRAAEMGVMETVGVIKPMLAGLVVLEGVVLAGIGGALGIGAVAGALLLWPVTLGVEGFAIDLIPEAGLAAMGLAVALAVGVVASIGPAIEIVRRPLAIAVKA
jgi:putative ABC transport system permease protein